MIQDVQEPEDFDGADRTELETLAYQGLLLLACVVVGIALLGLFGRRDE